MESRDFGSDLYAGQEPKTIEPVSLDLGQIKLTGDLDIDDMLRKCVKTMATKGAEYTVGSVDRLANFRGVGEDCGIPMEKAWYVFANKHIRAVAAYVKNGCRVQSNEPIEGRIMDVIVYMLLFHKMSKEIESTRAKKAAQEF